ncbi:cytochrome c oxidase subunit I [Telmatospirillum sp. J64-1]|uniref:cytochrome c oxidase subunit I n=1 Tax=Telmatospirillum sp. J64-1 TaxID=2502183 RepID=UPI00115DA08C|nr:cytochrome c oxidase subunit I [Telmatospirillum sp. J64-1]
MSKRDLLTEVWRRPAGIRALTEVNNVYVGRYFIATAFTFFIFAGILALLIRLQLAVPDNDLLDPVAYNQIFTMHGTAMMFLVAVPIMEGFAVYLLPQMLGARDLPFPRLSAFGYWCYVLGGILLFSSFLFGAAPLDGWFMYPPLSLSQFSPGVNADFWLLGITFVEISALTAAVEIIVGVMKTRAPHMRLQDMPIFGWYMLVTALMIIFAFPPLLVGDAMLEGERAFGFPFFDAARGGDPVMWQHLFWIFGHPEVYIIFLPAAGIVSTILPVMVGRPLVAHNLFILSAVSTGFISFGLWVHHMFTVGIPHLSLNFFSAASMAVAIPSGIQVFGWIATLWGTRPKMTTPLLFILGFLFIFSFGGLTGVMVASVPFDWQVHDTQFVVAHFHYVLVGGMIFPVFAALYYWMPLHSGRMMSERVGKWVFWLKFIGFNLTFGPLHFAGLLGMPRRVYLHPEELGLGPINFVSTIGAFMMGVAALLFIIDLIRHHRHGPIAGSNPWNAGSLEWAGTTPMAPSGSTSLPPVQCRYPLWEDRSLNDRVQAGEFYMAIPATGGRETMRTGSISGEPEQVIVLPGPTWIPLAAAISVAFMIVGGLLYEGWMILVGGVVTLSLLVRWSWSTDYRHPEEIVNVGMNTRLPTYGSAPDSHAWWGLATALLADLAAYGGLLFCYFYMWTVAPEWPPEGIEATGERLPVAIAAAILILGSVIVQGSVIALRRGHAWIAKLAMPLAALAGLAWIGLELGVALDAWPEPQAHNYPTMAWAVLAYNMLHVLVAVLMALVVTLRLWLGLVTPERSIMIDNTALFWHTTLAFALVGVGVVHFYPLMLQGG